MITYLGQRQAFPRELQGLPNNRQPRIKLNTALVHHKSWAPAAETLRAHEGRFINRWNVDGGGTVVALMAAGRRVFSGLIAEVLVASSVDSMMKERHALLIDSREQLPELLVPSRCMISSEKAHTSCAVPEYLQITQVFTSPHAADSQQRDTRHRDSQKKHFQTISNVNHLPRLHPIRNILEDGRLSAVARMHQKCPVVHVPQFYLPLHFGFPVTSLENHEIAGHAK